jgi:GNAT superfamily N-acetyltransferase
VSITIDALRDADLEDAVALSTGEAWNQTSADWRRLLRLGPDGCFGARIDGRLVATVTTTIYDCALAWIGMMIVHPSARRQGIGMALMARALEHLDTVGVSCIKLDATPAGLPLYRRLGFDEEVLFERWMGVATPTDAGASMVSALHELDSVLALDRTAFGADRSGFLAELAADAASASAVCESDSNAVAYALAREGRTAVYLGPIVATNCVNAALLFDALIARFDTRQVCIDLNTAGLLDPSRLETAGLAPARPLMRMRRGGSSPGTAATLCASAGPEYG